MAAPFLNQDLHIRWSTLTSEHIEADIRAALEKAQANLDAVIDQDRGKLMNFDSVVLGLDECTRELNEAWGLVTHLDSLCNSPALREAHNKMLSEVSSFFAKIPLNEHLWDLFVTYNMTDTEIRPEVAAGGGHGGNNELSQFLTERVEVLVRKRQEVGRRFNRRQDHGRSLVLVARSSTPGVPRLPLWT